jgi:hypothetical protein
MLQKLLPSLDTVYTIANASLQCSVAFVYTVPEDGNNCWNRQQSYMQIFNISTHVYK